MGPATGSNSSWRLVAGSALVLLPLLTGAVWAHGRNTKAAAPPPTDAEKRAFAAAQPAFERHCYRCHTSAGSKAKRKTLDHLNMDRYPFAGHHAHEIGTTIRRVLVGNGAKGPTMPPDDPGSVTGEDLDSILRWASEFDRAHPAPEERAKAPVRGRGRIAIAVTERGFEPSPILVKRGQPLTLVITRRTAKTCATEIHLEEYGIKAALPLGKAVSVSFTPARSGQLAYGCAMNKMIGGVIRVE